MKEIYISPLMKLGTIVCKYRNSKYYFDSSVDIMLTVDITDRIKSEEVTYEILDDAYKHVLFRLDRIDKINHKNLCTSKWLTKWLKLIETEMQRRMSLKDGE